MRLALRAEAIRSGDWRPHVYLEKSSRRTKDGEYLFELCWIKAQQEDWPDLAEHAEALVESVMMADAVRLAAGGLWNGHHLKSCLRLLNKYQRLFTGGVLPGDLWCIRVGCEVKTGSPQAVADAQELVRHDETAENIISLIQAHVFRSFRWSLIPSISTPPARHPCLRASARRWARSGWHSFYKPKPI